MRVLLSACAAITLSSCAGWGGGPAAEIRNVEWRAVDIGGRPAIMSHRPASMQLDSQGRAGGAGGCNQWHAQYRIERQGISFTQIGSTRMLCQGPAGEQENIFFDILQSVDRYTLWPDGALALATPQGRTIIFRRAGHTG
jgi:heat shock protein HslJ